MACAEAFHVHALVDGELDEAACAALERHLAGCAECGALKAELVAMREALRSCLTRHVAGPELKERLGRSLDGLQQAGHGRGPAPAGAWLRGWPFWAGAASGAAVAAGLVAALALVVLRGAPGPVAEEVLSAHLRSLMADHLIDVASSDRHTVKPWFAGRSDVSPPVVDVADGHFSLVGGRADFIDGRRAAVVVYRRGPHVVNVFTWPDPGRRAGDRATSRNGYQLEFWHSGTLAFCAVSDAAPAELAGLVRMLKAATPADTGE
jgi:anti-sigma factor RsiW